MSETITNKPSLNISEGFLLFLLAVVNFTHVMDFVVMAPLNPFIRPEMGITTNQFSFLLASYGISAAFAGLIGAFYIDRFDRREALLFLYTGFVLANIACARFDSYYTFMFARIMAGAFGGVLGSLLFSIIGDVIPMERRGKATGMVMAAFSAASVMGIPLGIYLANKINWHAPFMLLAALSAFVWLLLFFRFPSIGGHLKGLKNKDAFNNIIAVFKTGNLQWAMLFGFILMVSGMMMVPFLSDYIVNNLNVKREDIHLLYIFGGLASAVSGPLTGRLADKFGKQKVFVFGALGSIAPILIMSHLTPVPYVVVFTFSTIFFIFFGARFVPAMAMITSGVTMDKRGSFMSINSSIQQMGSALGITIGGAIISNAPDGSLMYYNYCGILSVVVTLLCVGISFKVKQVS